MIPVGKIKRAILQTNSPILTLNISAQHFFFKIYLVTLLFRCHGGTNHNTTTKYTQQHSQGQKEEVGDLMYSRVGAGPI